MKNIFTILLMTFIGLIIPNSLLAQPRHHNTSRHSSTSYNRDHHTKHSHYSRYHYHHIPNHNAVIYYTPIAPYHTTRYKYCYTKHLPIPRRVCEWREYPFEYKEYRSIHNH